jgi:hypothetical protein
VKNATNWKRVSVERSNLLEYVAERDIDLLLLEEIHASPVFRAWLASRVFGHNLAQEHFTAWHSLSHPQLGESDLVILFKTSAGETAAILLENKINAPPQPEQALRYRKRGEEGKKEQHWKQFRTCITAPETYLKATSDAKLYDSQVSYEVIRDWFRASSTSDPRIAYRVRLLDEAIQQSQHGYNPVPHEAVTQFWLRYWELVVSEFPALVMKQPNNIPADSDWPQFKNPQLGPNRRIIHKLQDGFVDLEIRSAAGLLEELRRRNHSLLSQGLDIVKTGKSASVRIYVKKMDRFGDFFNQIEAAREGLHAAVRLLSLASSIKGT